MSWIQDLFATVAKLSALEARTGDLARIVERVDEKLGNLLERMVALEQKHEGLRESVKNQILAEIKADIARVQTRMEYETQGNSVLDGRPQSTVTLPPITRGDG